MFKNLRAVETKSLNHSGRSYVGVSLQLEGDLRTSGSLDIAGLINGNIYVSDVKDTVDYLDENGNIRVGAASQSLPGIASGAFDGGSNGYERDSKFEFACNYIPVESKCYVFLHWINNVFTDFELLYN